MEIDYINIDMNPNDIEFESDYEIRERLLEKYQADQMSEIKERNRLAKMCKLSKKQRGRKAKGKNYSSGKKKFLSDERGVNTIEIVIILAVLVGIALIFRDKMIDFAGGILGDVLNTETDISPETIRGIDIG